MPKQFEKVVIQTSWTEYVAYFKGDHYLTTEGKTIQLSVVTGWAALPAFNNNGN